MTNRYITLSSIQFQKVLEIEIAHVHRNGKGQSPDISSTFEKAE